MIYFYEHRNIVHWLFEETAFDGLISIQVAHNRPFWVSHMIAHW